MLFPLLYLQVCFLWEQWIFAIQWDVVNLQIKPHSFILTYQLAGSSWSSDKLTVPSSPAADSKICTYLGVDMSQSNCLITLVVLSTPPKTNIDIDPQKWWLEYYVSWKKRSLFRGRVTVILRAIQAILVFLCQYEIFQRKTLLRFLHTVHPRHLFYLDKRGTTVFILHARCFFYLCQTVGIGIELSHGIHVCYIYLHLAEIYGKCWQIYQSWILWVWTLLNSECLYICGSQRLQTTLLSIEDRIQIGSSNTRTFDLWSCIPKAWDGHDWDPNT